MCLNSPMGAWGLIDPCHLSPVGCALFRKFGILPKWHPLSFRVPLLL